MAEALRDVQRRFLAGILGGGADAEALIVDDARVGARQRLDIYRNNYRASLTGVLSDHFERLHAYLGDEQFDIVAGAYVAATLVRPMDIPARRNPARAIGLAWAGAFS